MDRLKKSRETNLIRLKRGFVLISIRLDLEFRCLKYASCRKASFIRGTEVSEKFGNTSSEERGILQIRFASEGIAFTSTRFSSRRKISHSRWIQPFQKFEYTYIEQREFRSLNHARIERYRSFVLDRKI